MTQLGLSVKSSTEVVFWRNKQSNIILNDPIAISYQSNLHLLYTSLFYPTEIGIKNGVIMIQKSLHTVYMYNNNIIHITYIHVHTYNMHIYM